MDKWTTSGRRVAMLWAAIVLGSGILASSAGASEYAVQSVTAWKQNAAPMGWSSSLNRVFYNSRGADGLFDAYSSDRTRATARRNRAR